MNDVKFQGLSMVAKKNEKRFCQFCANHLLTFSQDTFHGELITESMFIDGEGQSPKNGEPMNCKKCMRPYKL